MNQKITNTKKKLTIIFFGKNILGDFLALACGSLMPLAFAPYGLFPLAIILPAFLLGSWIMVSYKRAAARGFLFGIGMYGTGISWIFISIHTYGQTPLPIALLLTILFISTLALFPALQAYLLQRLFPNCLSSKLLLLFPALWTAVEWMRSWLFTGFPWLLLGSSQIDSPLRGYAPLGGVFLLSLFATLTAACIVDAILTSNYLHRIFNLLFLVVLWAGGGLLATLSFTHPAGPPLQVSLVQGDISQEIKWHAQYQKKIINLYRTLTEQHWNSRLIVWPEAAIPATNLTAAGTLAKLNQQANQHHSAIILGIPLAATFPNHNNYYNGALVIGDGKGKYAKRHLVPFGEYLPFMPQLLTKIATIFQVAIDFGVFIPGALQQPLMSIAPIKISTFICYEIAFPEQVRAFLNNADVLLSISDDSWFGHSVAAEQHFQIARMRALETGRYLLQASNSGITAIVNSQGRVVEQLPAFTTHVLSGEVLPMQGNTPWVRFGMDPILLIIILMISLGIRFQTRSGAYR